MNETWLPIFLAALSGGIVAKLIDYPVAWVKYYFGEKKSAKALVDAHLDPLLKAADAIIGKTKSLAERDFATETEKLSPASSNELSKDLIGLAYLYASFWGRINILAEESLGVSLASDKRGAKLQKFIACLGSQRIRLVNRTHQNAIGELTTDLSFDGGRRTIGLVEFDMKITEAASARAWCKPLFKLLANTRIKTDRQQLLVYGVIVHALVDTLDPKHQSTHPRPPYGNKLSKNSKKEIKHLVFGTYLNETGANNRYT
ncbi:MAG: hypothetical protein OQK98_07230 [Gammaproteobacteria bacterium]|nr:hypothetical protein [Gammaproteobacteria bacterium]